MHKKPFFYISKYFSLYIYIYCRSTFKAAEWFFNHLAGQLPVVMVTNNDKVNRINNEKVTYENK